MGYCTYQYNPSELYKRTAPGTAPEVTCGARTFPAVDDPEVVPVRSHMGSQGAVYEYRHTGNFVARSHDDPYCPAHGGSPEPPPPVVTLDELEARRQAFLELVGRYQAQHLSALPQGSEDAPLAIGVDISEEDVREAAERYLADARAKEAVTSE